MIHIVIAPKTKILILLKGVCRNKHKIRKYVWPDDHEFYCFCAVTTVLINEIVNIVKFEEVVQLIVLIFIATKIIKITLIEF